MSEMKLYEIRKLAVKMLYKNKHDHKHNDFRLPNDNVENNRKKIMTI